MKDWHLYFLVSYLSLIFFYATKNILILVLGFVFIILTLGSTYIQDKIDARQDLRNEINDMNISDISYKLNKISDNLDLIIKRGLKRNGKRKRTSRMG